MGLRTHVYTYSHRSELAWNKLTLLINEEHEATGAERMRRRRGGASPITRGSTQRHQSDHRSKERHRSRTGHQQQQERAHDPHRQRRSGTGCRMWCGYALPCSHAHRCRRTRHRARQRAQGAEYSPDHAGSPQRPRRDRTRSGAWAQVERITDSQHSTQREPQERSRSGAYALINRIITTLNKLSIISNRTEFRDGCSYLVTNL